MKRYTSALLAGVVTLAGGCKDSTLVEPTDQPTSGALSGPLTRGGFQTLGIAVLNGDRAIYAGATSAYPIIGDIYARDFYRIDTSEPRWVNETLAGAPDPGSFAGNGGWTAPYTAIRQDNTTLQAIANPAVGAFTAAELNSARGFVRTFKALEYYRVLELRDTVGVAIQGDDPNSTVPGPIVCKSKALAYIAALLDSANTDLQAGSARIPLTTVPSGFALGGGSVAAGTARDYLTTPNFILFNRGLKGKVDFYRALDRSAPQPALFPTAIAELTQALRGGAPGAVPATSFALGPQHVFVPAGTEASANPYSDARLGLNPQVKDSLLPGDTRGSKIVNSAATITGFGLTTTITYVGALASTANQSRAISLLRDEELVLLRAQAEFEAGQFGPGTLDLNSVHTTYGLAPYATFSGAAAARSAALYDKRYSLLGEGVQRLVDLRAYGRLNATSFAPAVSGDPFNSALPIPKAESDARGGAITPSCS
jgi:starch-binding outer membrane protein, SusD/RagB family